MTPVQGPPEQSMQIDFQPTASVSISRMGMHICYAIMVVLVALWAHLALNVVLPKPAFSSLLQLHTAHQLMVLDYSTQKLFQRNNTHEDGFLK